MPAYRRAFLLSRSPVDAPEGLVAGPTFPGLLIDPQMRVQWAGDASTCAVVVLGLCLPTAPTVEPDSVADALVTALKRGDEDFFAQLETLAGRFVVIFTRGGPVRVTSDATAMGSVFYARRGGAIASRPELVELALGGNLTRDRAPSRHGFAGALTGFSRTRLLTAGTSIELDRPAVRRWQPPRPTVVTSTAEAAAVVASQTRTALRHALTLGAVRMELAQNIYGSAALALLTSVDGDRGTFSFAAPTEGADVLTTELARISGLRHEIVEEHPAEAAPLLAWGGATDPQPPANLSAPGHESLILVPSTLILSRLAYEASAQLRNRIPVDAESMVACHKFPSDDSPFDPRTFTEAWLAFNDYIDATDFPATSGLVHPFDQFYWEHRLSHWHAGALAQWDAVGHPFCVSNARTTVAALLNVSPDQRARDAVLEKVILSVAPELAQVSGGRNAVDEPGTSV